LHIQSNEKNGGYNNCYFKVGVCRDVGMGGVLIEKRIGGGALERDDWGNEVFRNGKFSSSASLRF
jgi:hypothetical protein